MSRIFDVDNGFFRFMTRVADALILNLLFLITSIPVVTIGASYTAMYYYCIKAVGNEEGYLWKSYWKSFKTNFVQGFLFEVIFAIIGIILFIDIRFMYVRAFTDGGAFGWKLLFFIAAGMAVLALMTFMYAFPVLSRFDNKTFVIIRNAAFMSIRHLPQTVPLLLIFGILALIGWLLSPVSIFFVVGAWVYISSIFFYKVLDRYMPKDEHYDEDYYLGADENQPAGEQSDESQSADVKLQEEQSDENSSVEEQAEEKAVEDKQLNEAPADATVSDSTDESTN